MPKSKLPLLLCLIAVDEVQHLSIVARLLEKQGQAMSRGHRSPYAQALRHLVRRGEGPKETVDRLFVSALIEACSCERFEILSRIAPRGALAKLYKSLWASEHGHYAAFIELATLMQPEREVEKRLSCFLEVESRHYCGRG